MRYGLTVIGNGPVGCYTALRAQKHADVALIGPKVETVRCAGLISRTGLSKTGLLDGDHTLNTVTGCRIHSPDQRQIYVDAKRPMANVVDRIAFDNHILDMAKDAGVTHIGEWVDSFSKEIVLKNKKTVSQDKIALASGSFYGIQHEKKLPTPKEYLVGGQYEMKIDCESDIVELFFDIPDFFSWIIPVDGYARIGLCSKKNPRPLLDLFVSRLKRLGRLRSSARISESFGVIPVHDPSMPTQIGDIRLVGDAAGQVKATTGGGVVMGCICGQYILEDDYDSKWRTQVATELRMHLALQSFILGLSDSKKNAFFSLVSKYSQTLIESGDMDYAKRTVVSMAKNPGFALRCLPYTPFMIKPFLQAFL